MRVTIDDRRCQGHGRCEQISDDIFLVNDDGMGIVVTSEPGDDLIADVKLAISNCPERAIAMVDD